MHLGTHGKRNMYTTSVYKGLYLYLKTLYRYIYTKSSSYTRALIQGPVCKESLYLITLMDLDDHVLN